MDLLKNIMNTLNKLKYQIVYIMSDKRRLFDLIVEENIPALHHLLDGYINDKGNRMKQIHDFILKNKIIPKNLNVYQFEHRSAFVSLTKNSLFISLTNKHNTFRYDYTGIYPILYENNVQETKLLIEELSSLMIQTSANVHATSLYFFIYENVLYLMTINSGLGIEKHLKHDNLYTPYMLYEIGDFRTENEQIWCVNIFFKILSLNIFYNILFSDNGIKPYKTIEEFNQIINLCNFIDYNMNITVDFNGKDITFNKRTKKIENDSSGGKYITCLSKINYYDFLLKFLKDTCQQTKLSEISENLKINELNFKIEDIIEPSLINDENQLLSKISLHKNDTNEELYIYAQEGGSCSWFSVYWVFLIHSLIFFGYRKYCKHIKKINNVMITKCKEIFTKDNIYNEINERNSTHSHALILLQKLISTNILDYSYINNFWDDIYKREMIFEFIPYESSIENLYFYIDNYEIEEILYFKIDKEKEIIEKDYFLLILYNLFLKNKCKFDKKINFTDIIKIIERINKDKKYGNKLININDISMSINEYNLVLENDLNLNKNLNYIVQFYFPAKFIMQYYDLNMKKTKYSEDNLILFINFLNKIYIFLNIQEKIRITIHYNIKNTIEPTANVYPINHETQQIIQTFYDSFFGDFYNIFITSSKTISFNNVQYDNYLNLNTFKNYICNFYKLPNFNFEVFDYRPNIKQFKIDELDINRYIDLNKYLLNNPDILTNDLGNNQSIVNLKLCVNFYNANYFEIYKNEVLKNKLLEYFMWLFHLKIKSKCNDEMYLKNIIKIILLFNDIFTEKKYQYHKILSSNLDEELNFLSEQAKKNSFPEFIKFKQLNQNKIKENQIKKTNIKIDRFDYHLIDMTDYNRYNQIIYNGVPFKEITINYNYGIGKLLSTIDIVATYYNRNNLLLIYKNGYVIIDLVMDTSIETETSEINKFKINKIYINGSECIKYSDIEEPFKYLSPCGCLNLITKVNDTYIINYFVSNINENECIYDKNIFIDNNNNEIKYGLLNNTEKKLENGKIFSVNINPINLLFPNKNDFNTEYFENICLKYGVNSYNYIFINSISDKSESVYNKKNYEIFNKIDVNFNNEIKEIFETHRLFKIDAKGELKDGLLDERMKSLINKLPKENLNLDSLNKILFNSSNCILNKDAIKRNLIKFILDNQAKRNDYIIDMSYKNNTNILTLIKNNAFKYLNMLILVNKANEIIKMIESDDVSDNELCSHIKIMSNMLNFRENQFNYLFELFFEFIISSHVNNEQYEKYVGILNHHTEYIRNNKLNPKTILNIEKNYDTSLNENIFEYYSSSGERTITLSGGTLSYPLYHFMMGKGKSAIITPLVMLYFALIHKKQIYIIVPQHLLKQTINEIKLILLLFKIKDMVSVHSDTEIKLMYLRNEIKKGSIMIIDEFDTIINPLTSNFNITKHKEIKVDLIYDFLFANVFFNNSCETIKKELKHKINYEIDNLLLKDINNIIDNITEGKLKENVNWGIHPDKCCAIPYASKDTPMLNSNFSSPVLTVFLTMYYYIIINKYKATVNIINFINNNYLEEKIGETIGYKIDILTYDMFNNFLVPERIQIYINILFKHIFNFLLLPIEQFNTSFIDILNMENVFKIGYSGTLNIDIPQELSNPDKIKKIEFDYDEKTNIYYALMNANLINETVDELLKKYINNYDALIDESGYFKNNDNYDIANYLYKRINRPVIYLNNSDEILIINRGLIEKYNATIKYDKPFFYYDQKHIVGTDIKQDFYPNIKGICLIDNNSKYTSVAQAMFRLRKINMGHTIDLLLTNFRNDDVIEFLNKNDEIEKEGKKKHLEFQILKSNFRKKRTGTIEENSRETIKYYYMPKDFTKDITEIMNGIFNKSEIQEILTDNKYNIEILQELIFNIDSSSPNQNKEIEKENEVQKQKELCINLNNEKDEVLINSNFFIPIKSDLLNNFIEKFDDIVYEFHKINGIKICFFVNLLSTIVYDCDYKFSDEGNNGSNILFLYLKQDVHRVIIMFRSEDLGFFVNKYPILNYNLLLINKSDNVKDKISKEDRQLLKQHFLFKIINKNEIISRDEINKYITENSRDSCYRLYIILNILHKLTIYNDGQQIMYDLLLKFFKNVVNFNKQIISYYPVSQFNETFFTINQPAEIDEIYCFLVYYFKRTNNHLKTKKMLIKKFFDNDNKIALEKILTILCKEDENKTLIFQNDLYINHTYLLHHIVYYAYLDKFDEKYNFFLLYLHYSNIISLESYKIDELIKQYNMEGGYQNKYLKYKNKLLQLK